MPVNAPVNGPVNAPVNAPANAPANPPSNARAGAVNTRAIAAIFRFEMKRFFRTIVESIVSPVISTVLYFVVFGSAIGSRIDEVEGVSYGAFIVPGLVMLTVITQSIGNASFAINFRKFIGTMYELLAAPVSAFELVAGFVGAAAVKSLIIAAIIIATSAFFVDLRIAHPVWMLLFLVLSCVTFSMFGFIIGIWAKDFQQLQLIPLIVVTPLVFLGGAFYSIDMLPPAWQPVALANPVVYLISGFRWAFFDLADVPVAVSLAAVALFLGACMAAIRWIFRTGWRIKA
jgi:ABC-2 type transport system permease protein